MSPTKTNPAVQVAKNGRFDREKVEVTLATGDRVRIMPVSASLIDEVTSKIPEPKIPVWFDKERDIEVPNPDHPEYIKAVDDMNRKRGIAAMDALVMFGVEFIDGMPEDKSWIKKLKFMEKRKQVDLSEYDLDDPLDQEFLYKRFIAVDTQTISLISEVSGISPDEVAQAEASFQG